MSDDFIPFSTSSKGESSSEVTIIEKSSKLNDKIVNSSYLSSSSSSSSTSINREIPWLPIDFNSKFKNSPPFTRLHNEILMFCEHIYPPISGLLKRDKVIKQFQDLIHSLWPTSQFHVFGSQYTRILTSSSDIDIAVLSVPTRDNDPTSKLTVLGCLYLLANKLKDNRLVSYVEVIGNAKVPIIKLDHIESGIAIDICINNDSGLHTGISIYIYEDIYVDIINLL